MMPDTQKPTPSSRRSRRVTLQDIANVAGVHKVTVSDALNGTGSVAPATRDKVRQIARELDYIPNFAARALATGRTGTIAVLSGPMNEPYYANMVHLLEGHINEAGFNLMLMRTPREVQELLNATGNAAVDGAIAVDMFELVTEFRSRPSVPCVSIGTFEHALVDSVIADLGASVEEALGLMLEAGRRRVAYLVTATNLALPSEVRARAYLGTMQRAGREPEIINLKTDDRATVEARFGSYIQEHGCPDALLCQNDETAACAFGILRSQGYTIPEDVLLVGCDGLAYTKYFDPPLSTIVQPMEEMCAMAWRFLMQRMANPALPHQHASLQGTLVVRKSLLATPGS